MEAAFVGLPFSVSHLKGSSGCQLSLPFFQDEKQVLGPAVLLTDLQSATPVHARPPGASPQRFSRQALQRTDEGRGLAKIGGEFYSLNRIKASLHRNFQKLVLRYKILQLPAFPESGQPRFPPAL